MRKNRGMAKRIRRIVVGVLAGCMLYGGCMQVSAATLKDVFDEQYYADSNEDLKELYGYDREKLWNHFRTFGIREGRNMNRFIDVAKYRAQYADLDAAFGDNWEAYLDHYLKYGAKERRDSGTEFNMMDYADRYEDLREVFGDDVLALWNHYQTYGAVENREARSEYIVAAEREAQRRASEQSKQPSNQPSKPSQQPDKEPDKQPDNGTHGRTVRVDHEDGSWRIEEYDARDFLVKTTYYDKDGNLTSSLVNEYDERGLMIKGTRYDKDGNVEVWSENDYDAQGNLVKSSRYKAGRILFEILIFGEGERLETRTRYRDDGSVEEIYRYFYDSQGNATGSELTYYMEDGTYQVAEYDADGKWKGETKFYDADGNLIRVYKG